VVLAALELDPIEEADDVVVAVVLQLLVGPIGLEPVALTIVSEPSL
jgi:hypothetical protein